MMDRFPIMGGPSVPWEVMVPHERQAMRNHGGQSLRGLANRGGLGPEEAWCVVSGIDLGFPTKEVWKTYGENWLEFAAGVNVRCGEMAKAVEPVLQALRERAPFEDEGWNLDYGLEVTVTVAEARALVRAFRNMIV